MLSWPLVGADPVVVGGWGRGGVEGGGGGGGGGGGMQVQERRRRGPAPASRVTREFTGLGSHL